MKDEAAFLVVWLVGLFGILGIVLAALTRMVRRDSTDYDKKFTWRAFPKWEEEKEGSGDSEQK
ncbi:hypothetical protein [Cohnella yongneupensis]|uniref:Uncharacterized protein n=1 Tax=Cohnella yongneupensis TaxID=425006 RepID=A0ABW0R7L9_9BACL